ncbi:MAG TPA: hypothetical protein VFO51_08495 [Sphingomicrobium sp.]|nr:hypothetical protein [Sphingomicrobium sp.]
MIRPLLLTAALTLSACGQAPQGPAQRNGSPDDPLAAEPPLPPETNAASANPPQAGAQPPSPCLVQDGKAVPANAIRAIGTEPFWGASVEGRCVTYSTPEDQGGTRVWTKFSGRAEKGRWTGALGGRPFVMEIRPESQCSDGMSDNVYPIAVTLTVGGELRTGCARPLDAAEGLQRARR